MSWHNYIVRGVLKQHALCMWVCPLRVFWNCNECGKLQPDGQWDSIPYGDSILFLSCRRYPGFPLFLRSSSKSSYYLYKVYYDLGIATLWDLLLHEITCPLKFFRAALPSVPALNEVKLACMRDRAISVVASWIRNSLPQVFRSLSSCSLHPLLTAVSIAAACCNCIYNLFSPFLLCYFS